MRELVNFLLLLALVVPTSYAQRNTRTISGLVSSQEDASPLEGVMVSIKGSAAPSGTQQDGMYYVEVSDRDSVLIFSLEGFQTRELKLSQTSNYNIALCRGTDTPKEKHPFSAIGNWRAVFQPRQGVEIPIIFDIRVEEGVPRAFFHNAAEQFESGQVKQTADSLFIFLDPFDNELAFHISDSGLAGTLRKRDGTGSPMPVTAEAVIRYRFKESGIKPAGDLSGMYDIVFRSEGGKDEKAVGLFRQEGNHLTGTFLRVTGDSRYLEGIVESNRFYLSSFIGSGPGYYIGTFTTDGQLTGEIAGAHVGQSFSGVRNEMAALPDANKLTWLKEGYASLNFSFPDVDGHVISLQDKKFEGKVVIVAIGGTWCPNCIDETSFLAPWYIANRARGVEIISIQYERQTDSAYVRKVITRFREKYHIEYDQVFGGLADKQGVARSLPALNTFIAFPTTIFIDRKGKVAQIHTGYSGPATGQYYQQFVKEFNEEVDLLLRN